MHNPRTVFIGYDKREAEAAAVCRFSIERHSSVPVRVQNIDDRILRHAGLYDRPFHQVGTQKTDIRDGRPFSTDFAFTRFLAPAINLYEGWALFCDCDFLFLSDVEKLFALADPQFAVMVVKHNYQPQEAVKMDGVSQGAYPRKNWSSLILWNCEHPANLHLTPQAVNNKPGSWLHGFNWLQDKQIGEIPLAWNWLSGVSDPLPDNQKPDAVHYTLGGPWFPNCRQYPFSDEWENEQRLLDQSRVSVMEKTA